MTRGGVEKGNERVGTIAITYRRDDGGATAGRIFDRLAAYYGRASVVMDPGTRAAGPEGATGIERFVRGCAALIVVAGPYWSALPSLGGPGRLLDDPYDGVRLAVEAALRSRVPIVVALVEDAQAPEFASLPESLRGLARARLLPVRTDPDFEGDVRALIATLDAWVRVLPASSPVAGPRGMVYPVVVRAHRGRRRTLAIVAALLVVLAVSGVGLYAYAQRATSGGPTGLTVPTARPSPSATPVRARVLYHAGLRSSDGHWPSTAHCFFQPDGYHIADGWNCSPTGTYGDLDLVVTVRRANGGSSGAAQISVRAQDHNNMYRFTLHDDGSWEFGIILADQYGVIVDITSSTAIHSAAGASNTIEIRARGASFEFYANGQLLGEASDTHFAGPGAVYLGSSGGEYAYTDFSVAQLD